MNRSETIGKLSLALSKAQAQIKGALRDSSNPFFKSKYADLESVWDAVRVPLTSNELAVLQLSDETDKGIIIETVLTHSSGEWVSGRMLIPIAKLDAQAVGSAITYARRYSLQAIAGVAPVDDDGEGAMGRTAAQAKSKPATKDDLAEVASAFKVAGITEKSAMLAYAAEYCKREIHAANELTSDEARSLVKELKGGK